MFKQRELKGLAVVAVLMASLYHAAPASAAVPPGTPADNTCNISLAAAGAMIVQVSTDNAKGITWSSVLSGPLAPNFGTRVQVCVYVKNNGAGSLVMSSGAWSWSGGPIPSNTPTSVGVATFNDYGWQRTVPSGSDTLGHIDFESITGSPAQLFLSFTQGGTPYTVPVSVHFGTPLAPPFITHTATISPSGAFTGSCTINSVSTPVSITGTGMVSGIHSTLATLDPAFHLLLTTTGQFDPGSTETFTVTAGSSTTTVTVPAAGTFSAIFDATAFAFVDLYTNVTGGSFNFSVGAMTVSTGAWSLHTQPGSTPSITSFSADPGFPAPGTSSSISVSQNQVLEIPGLSCNLGAASVTAASKSYSAVTVAIDIKPGSNPNCFNNDGKGVIPVAILGSASLDVTTIDPASVKLEGLAVKVVGKNMLASIQNVNGDSYPDLVVQIQDVDAVFAPGSGIATLTASLFSGGVIAGSDSICIVP